MIGKTLAHYKVLASIGAGGMGEVFRARDTKLDRLVALKLLPAEFSRDAERLARFEREARTLASLHHPRIASIFGLEQAEGHRFLVMELAEGQTLAQIISQRAVTAAELQPIGQQIAEGLEAAHERGIVHRDLKPANVMLSSDDQVKILDFGLARAYLPDPEGDASVVDSPTITSAKTQAGVIMGTAAYMSPEQARGKPLDRRTDIWSFGVVLFELLTGGHLFAAETVTDTLAKVVREEPDWSKLPADVPSRVRWLLQRCLNKDPKRRLQDIGEARIVLDATVEDFTIPAEGSSADVSKPRPARRGIHAFRLALAVIVGAILGAVGLRSTSPGPEAPVLRKFELPADALEAVESPPQLSPDGSNVLYRAAGHLWIRSLADFKPRALPDTEDARYAVWSPDGRAVAYLRDGRIWRMGAEGGSGSIVCSLPDAWVPGAGMVWSFNDEILFAQGNRNLMAVSARGGEPRELVARADSVDEHFHVPAILPGGAVLYAVHGVEDLRDLEIFVDGQRRHILHVPDGRIDGPTWSPTGHILYARSLINSGVWALPFSLETMSATGAPFLIAPHGSYPSVAADGTLMFFAGEQDPLRQLAWISEQGQILERLGEPVPRIDGPALSPNGQVVAYSAGVANNPDIWTYDLQRQTRARVTFDSRPELAPKWTSDGKHIVYEWVDAGGRSFLRRVRIGGSVEFDTLARGREVSLSRDGRWAILQQRSLPSQPGNIMLLDMSQDAPPTLLVDSTARLRRPAIAPGGQLFAYVSNKSGVDEIYMQRFPSGDGLWQVTGSGGNWPMWSSSGQRLFFRNRNSVYSVAIELEPTVLVSNPEEVFEYSPAVDYVSLHDGENERFLGVVPADTGGRVEHPLRLVENWFVEFEPDASTP